MITAANVLTMSRIVLVAPLLYAMGRNTVQGYALALALFAVASVTDFLDGRLARRYGQKTALGEFLDPLADKVLVIGVFVLFALLRNISVPLWVVGVVIFRDLFVTAMRVAAMRRGKPMRTERVGKIKTAVQMFSIIVVLLLLLTGAVLRAGRPYLGVSPGGAAAWHALWVDIAGDGGGWALGHLPMLLVSLCAVFALLSLATYILKNRHLFRKRALP
jgi:cardiolipin synthase